MISRLNDLITEFEKDRRNNPTSADLRRLEAVVDEAEADLDTSGFKPDAVYNAFAIYFRLQKHERRLVILKQYLARALPPIEEAWARWNIVDTLALMRKCEQLVPTHKAFLDWTTSHLQPDMRLWVMEDSTQALGWFTGGRGDDWIAIFHELNRTVPPSLRNRYHRFQYYRSASYALSRFNRTEQAITIAQGILNIAREDTTWHCAFYAEMVGFTALTQAHAASGNMEEFRDLATEAGNRLDDFSAALPRPDDLGDIQQAWPDRLHPAESLGRYWEDAPPLFNIWMDPVLEKLGEIIPQVK